MAQKETPQEAIQLLPPEIIERRKELVRVLGGAISRVKLVVGIFAILLLIILGICLRLNQDKRKLAKALEEEKARVESFKDFEQDFQELRRLLSLIEELEREWPSRAKVMTSIESNIPQDITLQLLDVKSEDVVIKGVANSYVSIRKFMKGLEAEERFDSVGLTSLARETRVSPIEFSIVTTLGEP